MKRALAAAALDPSGTFVAESCGTSVRMIETNYAKVLAGRRRDFINMGAPTLPDAAPSEITGAS